MTGLVFFPCLTAGLMRFPIIRRSPGSKDTPFWFPIRLSDRKDKRLADRYAASRPFSDIRFSDPS